MNILTGQDLYHAIISGGREILQHKDYINDINVFPVPDGDTGTNLAHTLNAVMCNAQADSSASLTMASVADAALMGARGNSGVIFAQFLGGMSDNVESLKDMSIHDFCDAVKEAVTRAYESMSKPVEGTILTVMKHWSESLQKHKHSSQFSDLLRKTLQDAEKSLKLTAGKIKEVTFSYDTVDAGAEGFVCFLRGISRSIKEMTEGVFSPVATIQTDKVERIAAPAHGTEAPNLRYCTELLLQGVTKRIPFFKKTLKEFGDSIIVAGNKNKIRVHIHTNEPNRVVSTLKPYGTIVEQKVDDMVREYEAAYARKGSIAIVTDAACDMPQELFDQYQIHEMPMIISLGGISYLDKRTFDHKEIYDELMQYDEHPTSSQPTPGYITHMYESLLHHYDSIISIHISNELSGTYQNCKNVANQLDPQGERISVVNSHTLSAGLATMVLRAAEMAEEGASHQEIVEQIQKVEKKQDFYVSLDTIDYLGRSGRVSGMVSKVGKSIGFRPTLHITKGGIHMHKQAFSRKGARKRIFDEIKQNLKKGTIKSYTIMHSTISTEIDEMVEYMRSLTGLEPRYTDYVCSPIGIYVGRDAVGLLIDWE